MRPQKTTIAILAAVFASLAGADDFKTMDGKEYKNATVTHVEADGIVVKSKSGISKIYFMELPPDVQQRFNFNPKTAAAAQANEMAVVEQMNQQMSAGDQQKALENQLSQLLQQEENLRVQIDQAKNAPQPTGPNLAAQAQEESLTQPQKQWQYKQRLKQYEGAKQAAARNRLNANTLVPPRYGDVTYNPYGTTQNNGQGTVTQADLPALKSQLEAVRQQREQVQRDLAKNAQPSK